MNMLKNWLPLAAMTQEDRGCFLDLKGFEWECLQESSSMAQAEWSTIGSPIDVNRTKGNLIPRLKLKEGEWYKYGSTIVKYKNNGLYFSNGRIHISKNAVSDTLVFRPATQSEIDSVKPEFKRGDVISFEHPNGNGTARIKENPKDEWLGYFSMSIDGKDIVMDSCGVHFGKYAKAAPDKLKNHELDELKHGKKWNGDGYDDFLTADGLTINEVIKHGIENIQFGEPWSQTSHTSTEDVVCEMVHRVNCYRLKPKDEGFVDVAIDWSHKSNNGGLLLKDMRELTNDSVAESLSSYSIGMPHYGWVLSKYKMQDETFHNSPSRTSLDGTKITMKATHARFVKL